MSAFHNEKAEVGLWVYPSRLPQAVVRCVCVRVSLHLCTCVHFLSTKWLTHMPINRFLFTLVYRFEVFLIQNFQIYKFQWFCFITCS